MIKMAIPTTDEIASWLRNQKMDFSFFDSPGVSYAIAVKRGVVQVVIVRFDELSQFRIQGEFFIGPEYEALYTEEKRKIHNRRMIRILAFMNLDFIELSKYRFGIFDTIFDDGFTYDRLHSAIRSISLGIHTNLQNLSVVLGLENGEPGDVDDVANLDYFV